MTHRALIICTLLLGALCLGAGAAPPARAISRDTQLRTAFMAIRGLIDRQGAAHFSTYPLPAKVRPGRLGAGWWPADPWTGAPISPGTTRGRYRYRVDADRRHYTLVGYLGGGRKLVLAGGMSRSLMRAYDHRGEEGLNLIRQYVEAYLLRHGSYPLPSDVSATGAVGSEPVRRYWPSNPWDHLPVAQRGDRGSFAYEVAADRSSYVLRLHRALKPDYILGSGATAAAWAPSRGILSIGTYSYSPSPLVLAVTGAPGASHP
jgi:hypothetical protein